jgi:thymidylate synthase, flavin-dependent
MKVYLLAHTAAPEKIVAGAAKLCYSASDIGSLLDGLSEEKSREFVGMLSDLGHESPTEHVSFTFGIEGVSRSLLAQITRHRLASYSVQSQRYVKLEDFAYVTPPAIAQDPEALELYNETMQRIAMDYETLSTLLKSKYYDENIDAGMPEKRASSAAEKKAIEDARFVLPNACETKMIVTMNTRSLQNFFRHRCCNRAQWEIRALADEMLRLVYGVAPALFRTSGAPCVAGPCPEGKMSCGKAEERKAYYSNLKEGK